MTKAREEGETTKAYGIRDRRNGRLLSILASTMMSADGDGPITSGRRYIEVEGAIQVGDFMRQPIFATTDVELLKHLLVTKVGNDFRNYVVLQVPFGGELSDLEAVDLATMRPVGEDWSGLDPNELRKENHFRDVRAPRDADGR